MTPVRVVVCGTEVAGTWGGDPLPFPAELEAVGFDRDVGPFPRTPLVDGVAETIARFRAVPAPRPPGRG